MHVNPQDLNDPSSGLSLVRRCLYKFFYSGKMTESSHTSQGEEETEGESGGDLDDELKKESLALILSSSPTSNIDNEIDYRSNHELTHSAEDIKILDQKPFFQTPSFKNKSSKCPSFSPFQFPHLVHSSTLISPNLIQSRQPVKNHHHHPPHPLFLFDPRMERFRNLLNQETLNFETLRTLSWNGIPCIYRGIAWRLLLNYSPPHLSRRDQVLDRKRQDYFNLCSQYYLDRSTNGFRPQWIQSANSQDKKTVHQIKIDVPRTLPHSAIFSRPQIQCALERVLTMWSFRHPSSGYVQGINDLVTPFFIVFLNEIIHHQSKQSNSTQSNPDVIVKENNTSNLQSNSIAENSMQLSPYSTHRINISSNDSTIDDDHIIKSQPDQRGNGHTSVVHILDNFDLDLDMISEEELALVEADSYCAVTKFIESIQDNYTLGQPGIQRMLKQFEYLIHLIDEPLCQHLKNQNVHFVQFAFRWMNCMLLRELPLRLVIRVWDTYLAEGFRFPSFHIYLCASILITFSKELKEHDFQALMMFLHHLPTHNWNESMIDPLLSQAYLLQHCYGQTISKLKT